MPTPYATVYKKAMSKITEPEFLDMLTEEREEMLYEYMQSACADFNRLCKQDLTDVDDELQQFNADLDPTVIEVLAYGICYYWLEPIVLNSDNFRLFLNTKDFNTASPANLLSKAQDIRDYNLKLFYHKMRAYSYHNNSL